MSVGPAGPTHERVAYQSWPARGNSSGPIALPSCDGRQNLGAVLGDRDRVLEMGGQGAVAGHDGPAVGLDRYLVTAEGQHRLDREADARNELEAPDSGPVVGELRLLVHLGADAVADELADDAVAAGRGGVLDRGRDVAEVGAGNGGRDAGHHRQAGRVDELGDLGAGGADDERPGAVAMPAVVDGPGIDRYDLALADQPLTRDAVDDLVVDGDAQAGRERVAPVAVALERWDRAGRSDVALGQAVEVARGDTRLELGLDEGQDLGHDPAGGPHLLDLAARLAGDHQPAVLAAGGPAGTSITVGEPSPAGAGALPPRRRPRPP